MKHKTLFLLTSLCSVCLLTSACTTCPTQTPNNYEHHHKKHDKKMHKNESIVFQQNYSGSDVHKVKANMSTRSSNGGEAEMGTIWFKETDDGLKMMVDLVYLRPNKTYTAEIYQCGA